VLFRSHSGYTVFDYGKTDLSWAEVVARRYCDTLIVDVENGPSEYFLQHAARFFQHIIVIGGSGQTLHDAEAIRQYAQLWVSQSVSPMPSADLSGVEYLMIDPRYAEISGDRNGHIVVSLGGSDPHLLTPIVISGLQGLSRKIVVINGPAAEAFEMVSDNLTIVHAPDNLLPYLDGAALLVGALGMTAYEAAAAGVPSLLTNWTPDHEVTALEMADRDVCYNLGLWDRLDESLIYDLAEGLLMDETYWNTMHKAGKALVDGCGVGRVVDAIEGMQSKQDDRMLRMIKENAKT